MTETNGKRLPDGGASATLTVDVYFGRIVFNVSEGSRLTHAFTADDAFLARLTECLKRDTRFNHLVKEIELPNK